LAPTCGQGSVVFSPGEPKKKKRGHSESGVGEGGNRGAHLAFRTRRAKGPGEKKKKRKRGKSPFMRGERKKSCSEKEKLKKGGETGEVYGSLFPKEKKGGRMDLSTTFGRHAAMSALKAKKREMKGGCGTAVLAT